MAASTKPANRASAMAERLAQDIPEGWHVNLGVGMPTAVANFVPADREVLIHSENGVLGVGPTPTPDQLDPWLVNASKQPITLRAGASLFHHADSFAMIRGGHIDLCVLGAYEVAANGDVANWMTPSNDQIPGVGGAMDLASGAKNLWIMMEHTTKEGQPKLVERCSYPLTALGAVTRVYTNLGVIDVTPRGFVLRDLMQGVTREAIQAKTGAKLHSA